MDRTAGWILASIALVVTAVLRVTADDEEHSTSYVIGAFLGSIVIGVLIGLLLRFAYVKLIRKGHELWSPWVLVIAAVVSLIVALSRAGEAARESAGDGGGRARDAAAATGAGEGGDCSDPARTAKELTASLPQPWVSAAADKAVVEQVTSQIPETERATARAIVRRGEPVAALLVLELTEEGGEDEEEFFAGFEEQAQGEVQDAKLGDADARLYRAPDGGGTLAGFSDPCAATVIFGASPDVVRDLAGDLPVEG